MSRIDEAMRRSSPGSHLGRAPARPNDSALRLAEDFTLNEYPVETQRRGAKEPVRVEAQELPLQSPSRQRPHEQRSAKVVVNQEQNGKLVVGLARDVVSTEQYRRLAATLHHAQVEKGLKTVMVTSSVPREGKTLTVVNLALTLSESYGRQVLLVDADLRRPSIHQTLSVPNENGLGEVLASRHMELPLVQVSERLWVLPSGRTGENPLAGLSSERMRKFLDEAASRFDWVLVDTPPVGLLPDAHVLGRLVQASVFVIRAGVTPFATVEKAIAELGRDCIIGTVLNGVDPGTLPTTEYYGHYYSKP
jgi:capsular exopolysaccharide synthesis family protein